MAAKGKRRKAPRWARRRWLGDGSRRRRLNGAGGATHEPHACGGNVLGCSRCTSTCTDWRRPEARPRCRGGHGSSTSRTGSGGWRADALTEAALK
eukprot:6194548-Pleurochrysis_carterae.AAC.2